jgi:glycosyltransferase involved in cell wall biosynthesis
MEDRPRISVVVGAFRRERFLTAAVRSVLAQTLPRDDIELLVTKGFVSGPVDRFLEDHRVRALQDDDPHIGPWLWRAISATSAPLVAFLDDDDLYEPGRLARVVEVFRDHPDVGYYRNRVNVVDADGNPLPTRYWGRHEVDAELDTTGPVLIPPSEKVARLPTLKKTYPLFNSSSIVIRRELLDGEMAERFRETQNPDPFLLLAAVVSPFGLFLDDRRLTRYRRHPENVTNTVWALRHGFRDSVRLAELAERLAPREYADWLRPRSVRIEKRLWTESIAAAVAGRAARREVVSLASGYLHFLQRHPEERKADAPTWAAPGYGMTYVLMPALAQRALRAARELRTYGGSRTPPSR